MIKTTIKEITEKFDENGKIVERITREETTEDDETRYPVLPNTSDAPSPYIPVFNEPYCETRTSTKPLVKIDPFHEVVNKCINTK